MLDFTGTDPQLQSSLNVPTGGRERHVLPTVGLVYVLYTLDPRLLLNAGILRVCRCVLPEGTMLNPQSPAAVGMRSLTCLTLMQVIFGAFSLALPERLAASPAGGLAIINVKTTTRDGRRVMASIGPVGGGAGGSADDGRHRRLRAPTPASCATRRSRSSKRRCRSACAATAWRRIPAAPAGSAAAAAR